MNNLINKFRYKYSFNIFALCGIFCILLYLKLTLPRLMPNYESGTGDISVL